MKKYFANKQQAILAILCMCMIAGPATAATTGSEFQAMAEMVIGWIEGWLGVLLSIAALGLGVAIGLAKQTLIPAIVGIGFALTCVMGPGIIQGVFTAVI